MFNNKCNFLEGLAKTMTAAALTSNQRTTAAWTSTARIIMLIEAVLRILFNRRTMIWNSVSSDISTTLILKGWLPWRIWRKTKRKWHLSIIPATIFRTSKFLHNSGMVNTFLGPKASTSSLAKAKNSNKIKREWTSTRNKVAQTRSENSWNKTTWRNRPQCSHSANGT